MKPNTINTLLIALIIGLAAFLYSLFNLYTAAKNDKNRLQYNIHATQTAIEYLKTKNNKDYARINALTNKIDELENSVIAEMKNLSIKVNRVVTYNETEITTEKEIITRLRDTAILSDSFSVIDYKDNYYKIFGLINADTARINIASTDSIIQVVYRGQRISKKGKIKPNWFFFTPRRLQQAIFSKNPNAKIAYSKFIVIE